MAILITFTPGAKGESPEGILAAHQAGVAYYVKHFCSCLFVVGQSEPFCHLYARNKIPVSDVVIDKDAKRISAGRLSTRASARYSSATGCVLE